MEAGFQSVNVSAATFPSSLILCNGFVSTLTCPIGRGIISRSARVSKPLSKRQCTAYIITMIGLDFLVCVCMRVCVCVRVCVHVPTSLSERNSTTASVSQVSALNSSATVPSSLSKYILGGAPRLSLYSRLSNRSFLSPLTSATVAVCAVCRVQQQQWNEQMSIKTCKHYHFGSSTKK